MSEDAPQVLVVGAGPVGLTMSLELARRGVRVRLVDAAAGPATTSRALATHARTLEIYDQMGVIDEILARGRPVQHFTMHRRGRRLVRFGPEYSQLPTRYPMTVMIDQALTEEILRTALARRGVTVEWNTRLEAIEPRPDEGADAVTVVLRDSAPGNDPGSGTSRLTVPWLVGCDGGHSTVRRALDLQLVGDSSETWLIADAQVETVLAQDSIHWLEVGRGKTIMAVPFPEPGRWRLLDTADVPERPDPAEVAARFAAKLAAGTGRPATVAAPTWISVFTIQQRMCPQMRRGRCFVAGDAAHVHSPASGQGMNTGVQDAFNLGWKLAMVVNGHADERLLDTYGPERVPVGAALLSTTKRATALIALKDRLAAATLPVAFAVIRNVAGLRHRIERNIMRGMSALALTYDDSALSVPGPVGPRRGAAAPGQRVCLVREAGEATPGWSALLAELRDPRWTLLVFAPGADAAELSERHANWLSVRTVGGSVGALADPDGVLRRDLGAEPGDWWLIRPDGYLSVRGNGRPEPALAAVPLAALSRADPIGEKV